jgi:uncharacterized protein YjbI with pentapeptide repeats
MGVAEREARVPQITTADLLLRYNAGERNFNGIKIINDFDRATGGELIGADLRGISLRGANLEDTILEGANLTDADLFGCSLLYGSLRKATLGDANLSCAYLCECRCEGANFGGCLMQGVNAEGSSFRDAYDPRFRNSFLIDTNLQGAITTKDVIYKLRNFIYKCVLPDGSLDIGPYWTDWP